MVKMSHDRERYQPVIDRIVGHIWDSAVDINEIPVGFPRAVFPNNAVLQATVEKYLRYVKYVSMFVIKQLGYVGLAQLSYTSTNRTALFFFFCCALRNTAVKMSHSAYIMSRTIIILSVWVADLQQDQLTCHLMAIVVIPLDYLETQAYGLVCEP
jgi:hypothetical protein